MKIRKTLAYDDVLLTPKYSDIISRTEVDIASCLGKDICFELPVMSAPMDTVTESEMCRAMGKAGGLGVIHRYNTIPHQAKIVEDTSMWLKPPHHVAAAVGVTGDYKQRAEALYKAGATIFCLDVAHGHHVLMERALKELKNFFGANVHLMAGNVATRKSFEDLASWGADSIRVGIGGGSICSTRTQTGHGVPGFQSVLDCFHADVSRDVKIIADGGIKTSGDMVKALAAGADFVMVGSMLAGTEQSPGRSHVNIKGERVKNYRGMASKEAQIEWRGKVGSEEGVSTFIPYKGCVTPILEEVRRGIRSGLSYSGARNILELQANAEFVVQTPSGLVESRTHIMDRFSG